MSTPEIKRYEWHWRVKEVFRLTFIFTGIICDIQLSYFVHGHFKKRISDVFEMWPLWFDFWKQKKIPTHLTSFIIKYRTCMVTILWVNQQRTCSEYQNLNAGRDRIPKFEPASRLFVYYYWWFIAVRWRFFFLWSLPNNK